MVWKTWCWSVCIVGVSLTWLGVDGVSLYPVTVVGVPFGSAVVSACVLPVVWPFHSCSLLFRVNPFLSVWGLLCSAVVWRLAHLLTLVVTVLLCLVWLSSDLTSIGQWFWLAWCLVMAILCQLPVLAHQPFSICLGLAMCFLWLMYFSLTILCGCGMIDGAFRLGCVLPVISASRFCFCRTLLLFIPLVLSRESSLVVVIWGLY